MKNEKRIGASTLGVVEWKYRMQKIRKRIHLRSIKNTSVSLQVI